MRIKLFDGHCDTILRCYDTGDLEHFNGGHMRRNNGHIQLEGARKAFDGYAQFFAIYADTQTMMPGKSYGQMFREEYELFHSEMQNNGDIAVHCRTSEQAEAAIAQNRIAAFLSVEGAEILDCSIANLEEAYDLGVRAVNITWNHANLLSGTNVEEIDRGLSEQGRAFVRRMFELGMLVDVSHLSDPGFWDVAALSEEMGKPFFASHSNSRVLCGHPRNLTDQQFKQIIKVGGVTGMNMCTEFLGPNPSAETVADHVEYFCALGGAKNIAMGGDWDGCTPPNDIQSVIDVEKIYECLLRRNFPEDLVRDIFFNNLMRVVKAVCTM